MDRNLDILAFLMTFYVHYIIGMTAFWFTQSSGIRGVFDLLSGVFSGVFIPLVFFPSGLQKLLFFSSVPLYVVCACHGFYR